MAQAGFTPILIYASGTATNVPAAVDLTSSASGAELAINYADGKLYYKDGSGNVQLIASKAGASGDVVGPASATDNAIVRFDGATGKLVQNSGVTIDDSNNVSGVAQLNITTLDATNIEVTNIKAKDGTAAASIADSTGIVTVTAAPVLSSLTASQAVFTTAGKALTSNAITGTGNVVMSASPTLTGTVSAAAATLSSDLTLNGGTANGVAYLNGSKVLTTGSALTFDGTKLVNTSGVAGALIQSTDTNGSGSFLRMLGDASSGNLINWTTGTALRFATSTDNFGSFAEQMRLTSTGLGIGTSSPGEKLTVSSAAATFAAQFISSASFGSSVAINATAAGGKQWAIQATANGDGTVGGGFFTINNQTDASVPFRLSASGNLGLGVTPSASWSSMRALQNGTATFANDTGAPRGRLITNAVYNGSNYLFLDASSNYALNYTQDGATGVHQWRTSTAAGTSPNTATLSDLMTLDASGNLLVGTTTAFARLAVNGSIYAAAGNDIQVGNVNNTNAASINSDSSDTSAALVFKTAAAGLARTERARITSGGNFKIGGTADRGTTEGDKQLVLFDGTAPVGTLTNGVSFYSASGEARVMDAAGNSTLLSPHDSKTNEWIFHSKHTPTGKVLRIDVERLLKFVNDHFGLDAVQEFIEP